MAAKFFEELAKVLPVPTSALKRDTSYLTECPGLGTEILLNPGDKP